jgi:hypothetical protein
MATAAAAAAAAADERTERSYDSSKRQKRTMTEGGRAAALRAALGAKNAKPGELRRNETRDQLRARAPVVMPQPMLTNWGTSSARQQLASVTRQHRFFGEGDDGDVNRVCRGVEQADPSLTMYATFTRTVRQHFQPIAKTRKKSLSDWRVNVKGYKPKQSRIDITCAENE